MQGNTDPRDNDDTKETKIDLPLEPKQQQSDPNITELKGFVNKDVPFEPNAKENDKHK